MLSLHRISRGLGFSVFKRNFSAPVAPFASHVSSDDGKSESVPEDAKTAPASRKKIGLLPADTKNPIVAAAFASLLQDDRTYGGPKKSTISNDIDDKILNANSVNDLLGIPGQTRINRKQALKIVSILAEWSSIQKVKLSDFENDLRFIQLCSVLGRTNNRNNSNNKSSSGTARPPVSPMHVEDLQTVLGVTANDEAAKLIAGLTVPQMIKVMSTLAQRKKRSTSLLRSLAFNISSNNIRLNLKECGDLLYAMANLNFRDPVLTARVCVDVESELGNNKDKPAPIGSILTSLSMLRYRDMAILDSLSEWVVLNSEICKPSHLSALLLSLATLCYEPVNIEAVRSKLVSGITQDDFIKSIDWLNTVWSLAVLNCASKHHLLSVLTPEFIDALKNERNGDLTPAIKMKLLNLKAYADLILRDVSIGAGIKQHDPKLFVPIDASKEKRVLITGMLDALKSLLPSENHVKINERTTMGFAIDAECVLDSKCLPLAVNQEHPNARRIALLVHDYHDMCQGPHPALNGMQTLACRLLEQSGYSVLSIPYKEFNTSDKLLKRVEYLQKMFRKIVSANS